MQSVLKVTNFVNTNENDKPNAIDGIIGQLQIMADARKEEAAVIEEAIVKLEKLKELLLIPVGEL
jgi:hypothetical protein